ncbi:MAG: DegV family protein [Actinobacteria bacterium]|nr:DegV family protein [Actinomycetota bacterium]
MNGTILVAETGADIPTEIAAKYGIWILPMHISLDGENLDDGAFPVERIYEYHKRTRKLPTTSATSPGEYRDLFLRLHEEQPDKQILHLCYSAVTTATYQNAVIGSEGMSWVTHVDTKNVSGGQAALVIRMARYLEDHPLSPVEELVAKAEEWVKRLRFCFIPGDLDYLRAGGRVSNASYLGAAVLGIKPLIEMEDGKLVSTKKYRGPMKNVCIKMLRDALENYNLETETLYFVHSEGLLEEIKREAEATANSLGYRCTQWIKAGGVISTHSGPGGFGVAGFVAE